MLASTRRASGQRADRALVLRRFPWSESSLVARVLTREHGRVHLMARGAHRPRSRFFALLDLFDTLVLEWSESPRRELGELRGGELHTRRRGVTGSLERYRAGVAMLELCDLGSHPGQADASLFDLLEGALDALADAEREPWRTLVEFELRFLQNHGLAPALLRCATCAGAAPALPAEAAGALGRPGPPADARGTAARAIFSAKAGGRLCAGCAEAARRAGQRVGTLPVDVLLAADALLRGEQPFSLDPAGPLDTDLSLRLRDFVERFLATHLEQRPRAQRAFLAPPNRNARPEK